MKNSPTPKDAPSYGPRLSRTLEPRGLRPKIEIDMERRDDVTAAVTRYMVAGKEIPYEWISEYNLLTARLADAFKEPKEQ